MDLVTSVDCVDTRVNVVGVSRELEAQEIGIGGAVTRSPLPHHRTCGSAYGGSVG
jgi:hypothetical protein